jgi:hypothetical protein
MAKRWWATGIGWFLGGPWWGLAGYLLGDRLDRKDGPDFGRRDGLRVPLLRLTADLLRTTGRTSMAEVQGSVLFWLQALRIPSTEAGLPEQRLQSFLQESRELHAVAGVFASGLAVEDRLQFWWRFEELADQLALPRARSASWLIQVAECWDLTRLDSDPGPTNMACKGRVTPAEITRCYQVLGLPLQAGWEDIKRQYRKLAKAHHPDLLNLDAACREEDNGPHNMAQINSSYRILKSWFGCD